MQDAGAHEFRQHYLEEKSKVLMDRNELHGVIVRISDRRLCPDIVPAVLQGFLHAAGSERGGAKPQEWGSGFLGALNNPDRGVRLKPIKVSRHDTAFSKAEYYFIRHLPGVFNATLAQHRKTWDWYKKVPVVRQLRFDAVAADRRGFTVSCLGCQQSDHSLGR